MNKTIFCKNIPSVATGPPIRNRSSQKFLYTQLSRSAFPPAGEGEDAAVVAPRVRIAVLKTAEREG